MELISTAMLATSDAGGLAFTTEHLMRFLGRLHPAVVHFPIALILVAVLFEAVAAVRHGPRRSTLAIQCLALGAIGAAVAAWFGWISAEQEPPGRSVETLVFLHRWSGVAAAGLAALSLLAAALVREGRPIWALRAYRGGLLVCGGLVATGGYIGAELVYGQGHLIEAFRVAPDAAPRTASAPPSTSVEPGVALVSFDRDLRPILEKHCVHCHGPNRQRGRLRLDEPSFIFEGPPDRWVVVPGDPAASELIHRIELPADDPDLMPADGEPLPEDELEVIATWIAQGAPWQPSTDVTAAGGSETASPTDGAAATDAAGTAAPVTDAAEPDAPEPDDLGVALTAAQIAARDGAIARIVARGGLAAPVALNANAVDVNLALVEPPVTDEDLELLAGLEPALVWLDLSGSEVTDAGLERLGDFTQLRRLSLARTDVGDAGLERLAPLAGLRTLNLHSTAVTDQGARLLALLPSLERVYLWGSRVTAAGGDALRQARPTLVVDLGAPALPPPAAEPVQGEAVAFETQVLPILKEHCVHCHGPSRMRADLRLDTHEAAIRGSVEGAVIVAGDADGSALLHRISLPADDPDLMPADGDPLSGEQVAVIRAWIAQGAKP